MLETRDAAWENGAPSEPAQQHQRLLVCTAHIHWDPEFCDVKLIQTMMLMHEVRDGGTGGSGAGAWVVSWC